MKLIKAATAIKCELPESLSLSSILEDNAFVELGEQEFSRAGFVDPGTETGSMVRHFPDGFAFRVRYDEKILPAAAINAEVSKRMKETLTSEKDKKERAAIKDQVYFDLLKVALVKTNYVTCHYLLKKQLLIVPTSSKKIAGVVIGKLIRSIGSIKTTTLHIDGIKNSLTEKLRAYADGVRFNDHNISIGDFSVGCACKIKGEEESATFKMNDLSIAVKGILEAIDSGGKVIEIELCTEDLSFRLNSDFVFKGIHFNEVVDDELIDSWESDYDEWMYHASTQTLFLSDAIDKLLKLFEYKDEENEKANT